MIADVKKEKCYFFQDKVNFLGHKLDANGLHMLRVHMCESNVKAAINAPIPQDISQLRAFL